MDARKRVYLPYIIGIESPIPYLFEQIIPHVSEHYDVLVHSQDGSQYNLESVRELRMSDSYKITKALKFGAASLKRSDLIHTGAGDRYHLYASRLARLRNPSISHIHTFRVDIDSNRWNPGVRLKTAEMADEVTAVSKHTAQTAEREFGISPTVIYNGVDVSTFSPERGPSTVFANMGLKSPVVMFVGSFKRRKRPLDFVEVASRIPDAEFVMAGQGPLFGEAKSEAQHIENLHLLGRVEKSKLPAMYADAELLLFPTVQEGCPNVVLEAFASGTPVVGYNATSMPELVENGERGKLVAVENVDALTDAVDELIHSQPKRFRRNAREYAIKNHRFERISEQYIKVYNRVLS